MKIKNERVSRRSDVIGRQYNENLPFEQQMLSYDVNLQECESYYYDNTCYRYGTNDFSLSEIPKF